MIWIFIFIISFFLLFWSGSRVVTGLMKIAKYLGWREFVVAFFVMAFAGALPNLFVGISSALKGIPELSFGEIVGGNVVDMTLAVGLALLIGGKAFPVKSKMVQTSAIFTAIIAILPLILILDGDLSRGDGIILLLAFVLYIFWLFSKEERFRKVYRGGKENNDHSLWKFLIENKESKNIKQFKSFLKSLKNTFIYLVLLVVASWGIVQSVQIFSNTLNIGLPIIGILIIGLGNALPETYFAIILGVVAVIHPIINIDFSPFAIARIFLIISAVFFLIAVRTDQRISKREAVALILIYIVFVLTETFFH